VANVSPTLTPTLVVAVVVGMAGTASWLVYIAATIAMVIVGINVGKLAKRIPCAGSFFIYVSRSLGPSWGLLAGWAMLAAYLTTAMALTVATSIFIKTLFSTLHIGFVPNSIVLYAIISGLALLCASRDIRFSSRMGLTLEVISVALIMITCVVIVSHYGFKIDLKQLDMSGLDYGKAIQAIVFAIFSYVGFESAATLGQESRNPERVIPRAIITTALVAGLFFIITTYVVTQGFNDDVTKLGASGAPLGDIISAQSPTLFMLVYLGATVSSFACALASLNAFGRMMYSLGRYQFLHTAVGRVHPTHQTPYIALGIGAALNFLIVTVFSGRGAEIDAFGWYGTLASFGFIVVYFLCSLAAPILLKQRGELTTGTVVFGGLGALLMVLSLVGSLYPLPVYPLNLLPVIFIVYMAAGALWFFVLRQINPASLLHIEHDLEIADIPAGAKVL
jgi:amino acid transporter